MNSAGPFRRIPAPDHRRARPGEAVAGALPGAVHRVLEGQVHYMAPEAIVPEQLEFLITA